MFVHGCSLKTSHLWLSMKLQNKYAFGKTISIPYNWTVVNRFLVACSSIDHLGYIYAIRVV
jgi:hypothetical protein